MADNPTKKASAFPLVTASSAADSIPIVRAGVTSRIHPASGGGLDADTVDGYQGATLYIPRGYIDGLICSNAADAEHDITIAAGVARDSTNVMPLILAAAITKRIDAAWAAGTNAGGLDAGAIAANTVYYIWIIHKDSDGSIDALFSLSETAPTMPAGYTYKRRIMSVCTDASANIIPFHQIQDFIKYTTPIIDRAYAGLPNTSRNAYALTVPPSRLARVQAFLKWPGESAAHYAWVDDQYRVDAAASATNYTHIPSIGDVPDIRIMDLWARSTRQIYARGDNTGIYMELITLGWIDDRGRNA